MPPGKLGIDDGETLHSLRHGCAVTLAVSRPLRDVMSHCGWKTFEMAERYSRSSKLTRAEAMSTGLGRVLADNGNVEQIYRRYDESSLPSAF